MIKLKNNIFDIKGSNLVFLVEKIIDLKLLDNLRLDIKIIKKIKNIIKENKNKELIFFLGSSRFENLYIYIFSKEDKNTLLDFLGKKIPKLPENLTILSNNDKNLLNMLDISILSRHKFQKYKTKKRQDTINIIINKNNEKIIKTRLETIYNIILSKELGNTPSNDLIPEKFVKLIKITKWKNTKIKILTPSQIQKKGLNLLWAVGKGSINKPYMVILERIVNKNAPTYGFIGKGIVFDTGGIQVKPENYMYEMKGDMCGAATVYSVMKELDNKKLNVNIIACLPIAENHISGESFKPSDIYISYSGKTVDIGHTDAEGRLVLADAISYISKNYNTTNIITLATLTGAVVYALGYRYAGIMGTDKKIINSLLNNKTHELYWELPFDDYFVEQTKSEIADLENIDRGVKAGSTMGGAFLYNFIENKEKFTHIDIGGSAINSHEAVGLLNKGMTGFGVDSLSKLFLSLDK